MRETCALLGVPASLDATDLRPTRMFSHLGCRSTKITRTSLLVFPTGDAELEYGGNRQTHDNMRGDPSVQNSRRQWSLVNEGSVRLVGTYG